MSFPARPRGNRPVFSRANPRPAAAVQDRLPVEEEGDDLDYLLQPNWLKPFSTAPNVRFTRTPDSLSRGKATDEPAPVITETAADDYWLAQEAEWFETHLPEHEALALDASGAPEADAGIDDQPAYDEPLTAQSRLFDAARRTNVDVRPIAAKAHQPARPDIEVPGHDLLGLKSWPSITVKASFMLPEFVIEQPAAPQAQSRRQRRAAAAAHTLAETPVTPAVVPAASPLPGPAVKPVIEARTDGEYELPPLDLLALPDDSGPNLDLSEEYLDRTSFVLQQTLHDFGVKGEIIDASPGPVVTLYELEPAPGTKSSRVISLSADIARSMSAVSARVAVVEGRNVIGIELPNNKRETVYLRELLASHDFATARTRLGLCLGKTIGGEPVIADLARMPHLLVAGTTGSGKSVAINTMILSLLYRMTPEECRLIMIDPKMLELSVYEGIPHLLTPVVTDPRKAVVALKWAVREMEERYKKMSKLGVRNIDGFNQRIAEIAAGTAPSDEDTATYTRLPYIVVIVDEMADLMMVAGKDIEGAIQRLAQMARAAGIHLIMATQRPSVDVITGTIKANFPTRISFQVTSKIDSRTILGEMGAEQLLGQGDMLYMAGGGRITRVHGPFVSDSEVEHVVDHLKAQGRPDYLDDVTALDEMTPAPARSAPQGEDGDAPVFDACEFGDEQSDMYDQAVAVVLRDRKASTSYIQRRLGIGYNRAASIMERMENEGIVGQANHAGKREILLNAR